MPFYIGLMSGTSMDSVDAALLNIDATQAKLQLFYEHPIPEELKTRLQAVTDQTSIAEIASLDRAIGDLFARATQQLLKLSATPPSAISAIGSHGQTVLHKEIDGDLHSLQIGDANRIAQQTGITTVADFRRMDIAHGGQGAPLAPAFHQFQFAAAAPCVILNIGGFSNITVLAKNSTDEVIGFDCGPGNILMDTWIQQQRQQNYDTDGAWAASGKVNQALLESLLEHPFFEQAPPKSTGRDEFNADWLQSKIQGSVKAEDVQATLLQLTVLTIARAIESYGKTATDIFVCGGGAYNQTLMQALQTQLASYKVCTTDDIGIPANAVEAVCFAWLAHQRLEHQNGNLPSVTGAERACVMGAIYESQDNQN